MHEIWMKWLVFFVFISQFGVWCLKQFKQGHKVEGEIDSEKESIFSFKFYIIENAKGVPTLGLRLVA